MKKKFTKLEKELLDVVSTLVFYGGHAEKCEKNWYHDPRRKCTCRIGVGLINGNILLNKYGMGFSQQEVDKTRIKSELE